MSKPAPLLFDPIPAAAAADLLAAQPVVTQRVFAQLLPELKARAFTLAGLEAFDTLAHVRQMLGELPPGGDWQEQKRSLLGEISPYLVTSDDPAQRAEQEAAAARRAELLLRTHGTQAHSAAAYRQMDAQRDRLPYWQYQSLGDGRVRESHAALDGIVLPASSQFWESHFPPWEWGCRCQVIPLSADDVAALKKSDAALPPEQRRVLEGEALARLETTGTLTRPADLAHRTGPPTAIDLRSDAQRGRPGAFRWHPTDLRLTPAQLQQRYAHDPQTWQAFQTWAKATQIPEQDQTVWEWMDSAAPAIAAPPTSPDPASPPSSPPSPAAPQPPTTAQSVDQLRPRILSHTLASKRRIARAIQAQSEATSAGDRAAFKAATAELQAARADMQKGMLALLELPAAERTTLALGSTEPSELQALDFVRRLTHPDVVGGPEVAVLRTRDRPGADPAGQYIDGIVITPKLVAHELGHIIEARNPAILAKSLAFLDRRTVGDVARPLGVLYEPDEMTKDDQWEARGGTVYTGKHYEHLGVRYATEILSSGLERLHEDAAAFFQQDPDFFAFVIDTLRGL